MQFGKKEMYYELLDEISKFTKDKIGLLTILCGIEDEDMSDFIKEVKKIKTNKLEDLLEVFITFRNERNYTNEDVIE